MRLLPIVFLILAACGDDGGPSIDAAPEHDATAEPPDGAADRCMALCECAVANCAADFPDMTACLTDCEGLDESVKLCRIEHCGYAQTNPGTHCPHVAGDPNGGVSACVQP